MCAKIKIFDQRRRFGNVAILGLFYKMFQLPMKISATPSATPISNGFFLTTTTMLLMLPIKLIKRVNRELGRSYIPYLRLIRLIPLFEKSIEKWGQL